MAIISKANVKKLLRNSGRWVLSHKGNDYGRFREANIKPEAIEMFQEKVTEYAKSLALASNVVARDGQKLPEEKNWHGQHIRFGHERDMIHGEDVEIAAALLENIGNITYMDVVGPEPCKACGREYDYLNVAKGAFICPHCNHVVVSLREAYREGDSLPESELVQEDAL